MKMRHARQDAAAKVKEIQSEAKLDPVNHAELKGSHADRKDKDINNDGKSDKTDEYLHKRRKAVKKAIANKPIKLTPGWGDGGKSMKSSYGKLAKEEQEFIDSLNNEMFEEAGLGESAEDKHFAKQSQKMQDAINRHLRRGKDYKTAVKHAQQHVNEEAEQIDEISGKTLVSYSDKVARYGPMKDVRTRQKHEKGIYTAYKKMKAKDVKVPARMEEADVPFEGPYRKTGERKDEYGNTVKNVAKHLAKKAMKKQMGGLKKEEAEQIEESLDLSMRNAGPMKSIFGKSSSEKKSQEDRAKRLKKKVYGNMMGGLKKEEAEQIDEISAKTIDRYREQSHRKEYPGPKGSKKYEKRARGSIMAFNKLTGRAKVPATESFEMTEARGRPRKDAQKDYTIHPKTKEKLMHNNPAHMKRIEALHRTGALQKPKVEAGQNIITQLRKASTSMRGGEKVNFNYGASTHVSAAHAQKILDKHASMKPAEKEKFQKNIGHSHAMLKKHV
jgi:hypothetical protein